jgi:hypothetical protein
MDLEEQIEELVDLLGLPREQAMAKKDDLNDFLLRFYSDGYRDGYDIGLNSGLDHGWRNGYQARSSV